MSEAPPEVFGYVRVSTIEQTSGYGQEAQELSIREYCTTHDLPDPQMTLEQGSGESISKRTQFLTMIARAEDVVSAGGKSIVVFHKLDRLSRNLIDQEATILKSFKTGIQFRSTDPVEADLLSPEFQGDPMRAAMRQIVGVFAQLERATIQARLDGGLAIKASKGGFTGGTPPLGYKAIDKELVIDEKVAPAIRRVFKLKASRVTNTTILAICARDYPVCRKWHKSYIGKILLRAALYCRGEYRPRGGDVAFTLPNLVIVHGGEVLEDPAPGEIDWDKVQPTIKLNSLTLLLGVSADEIKKVFLVHSLPMAWFGVNTQFRKETAMQIHDILQSQQLPESKDDA